jgi:hypothetical protein
LPVQEKMFGDVELTDRGPAPRALDNRHRLDSRQRMEKVTEGLDRLRRKYAQRVVMPATLLGRDKLRGRDGSNGKPKV